MDISTNLIFYTDGDILNFDGINKNERYKKIKMNDNKCAIINERYKKIKHVLVIP